MLRTQRTEQLRRIRPFVVALAVSLSLAAIPPGAPHRFPLLALATAGFVLCGALIVFLPWDRMAAWPRFLVAILFCASVGVVREATGGAASGFGILLLLPVIWQAAYGHRRELMATVGLVSASVVVPILVLGEPDYPVTEWRKALMLALTAGMIGEVVRRLVRDVRQERSVVAAIGRLARSTASADDPRRHICEATQEITGADMVVLFEPLGRDLRVTQSVGIELPMVVIPEAMVTSHLRTAIDTLEPMLVRDAFDDPEAAGPGRALGMRGLIHHPGSRHGTATVVLSVGWRKPLPRELPSRVRSALPILAADAAAAVERADLMEQLGQLARQDPLTGLMNRRAWDDHLAREVARTARTGRPLTVAVLDLDRFKAFNDEHGHLVGDQLLKAAAGSWSACLRTADVLARWGGEEFALLLPDTDADAARETLARLAARVPMAQTFSAGFVSTTSRVDPDLLMAGADAAVYAAKEAGRNRVVAGAVAPLPEPDRSTGPLASVDTGDRR